jgi:uncharacterized protein YceK
VKYLVAVAALILLALAAPFDANATSSDPVLTTLYNLQGGLDGAGPEAGLLLGKDGTLYGTTAVGGGSGCGAYGGCGTVFKLTPPTTSDGAWTEAVLYRFLGGNDGWLPSSALITDSSGALYGTTQTGGAGCGDGSCGTVFKLTPPTAADGAWTHTILHAFTGGSDGRGPANAGLAQGASGTLYGTTANGGNGCPTLADQGCGTVYKLTPPTTAGGAWTETVLRAFGQNDGYYPSGALVLARIPRMKRRI